MTLSQTLALWADRLRDISSVGLMFADNIYHHQRYEALQSIALEMFALATGEIPEQLEPLRATVMRQPSAISTADAAIIDEAGRILVTVHPSFLRRRESICVFVSCRHWLPVVLG